MARPPFRDPLFRDLAAQSGCDAGPDLSHRAAQFQYDGGKIDQTHRAVRQFDFRLDPPFRKIKLDWNLAGILTGISDRSIPRSLFQALV